jgi:hypothetical protein
MKNVATTHSISIKQDGSNPYILSSVSITGIFCLGQDRHKGMVNTVQAVLWNLATAEFLVIPPSLYHLIDTLFLNLLDLVMTMLEMTIK